MKILQLCVRVPYPPSDGATIAMYNISKSFYENGVQLKILSFNTNKNYVNVSDISTDFKDKTSIETVDIDLSVKPFPAFLNLFTNQSYNITRFISKEFEAKLKKNLEKESYDIVHLEGLFLTPYIDTIRKHSKAKIVLRSHNVEFMIWERLTASTNNPVKKSYLKLLTERLKKYELNLLNSYDAIATITPVDKETYAHFGCEIPIMAVPLGVDVNDYKINNVLPVDFSIFHLGSMDWMPNLDAVDWFLNNVHKKLVAKIPHIKIYLAGKDMPQRIKDMADNNLIVMDRIANSKEFMQDKGAMIVPLLSGGGMRVKIIEGMAAGKPIVSTSIGAEGINYTDNENILIADTPDDFIHAIFKLLKDPLFCKQTGTNARKLVAEQYDNKVIGSELIKFYQTLLS